MAIYETKDGIRFEIAGENHTPEQLKKAYDYYAQQPKEPSVGLPSVSPIKSSVLGFSQGASMGFADEAAGAIAGAGKDIMSGKLPSVKSYVGARDSFRQSFKESEEANPKTYLGSEFAGGASTALIPGTGGVTLPKLAALGAIQGLGDSEADLIQGDVTGTARDAGFGALTSIAFGKALPVVKRGARSIGKPIVRKLFSSVLGPSEEAVESYLKNPKAIKSASMEGLAEEMPEVANKFKSIIKDLSGKARETLSTSRYIEPSATDSGGAFTKDEVFNVVAGARKKLGGVYTDDSKAAAGAINRIKDNLKKIRNTVSQNQVHDLITDLDNEIPWDKAIRSPETLTAAERALINVRTGLSNALKQKNKAYEQAIKPVEEAIEGRNQFTRKFSIKRSKGEGYVPSDTTYSRTNTALNEGRLETDRVIQNVKKITGIDIEPKVRNAKYAQEFSGGRTNGSRNVNTLAVLGGGAGGAVGSVLGLPVVGGAAGAMAGSLAGSYIDKKGGEIAMNLLDKYLSSKQNAKSIGSALAAKMPAIVQKAPEALGKYAPIMKHAARLGAQQLMLQHWLLLDSDPEYQETVGKLEGETKKTQ